MASNYPIPLIKGPVMPWLLANPTIANDVFLKVNQLFALVVVSGGRQFPIQYSAENAYIEFDPSVGGGGGNPGGSDTELQYNAGGSFGGIANATSDGTNLTVTSLRALTAICDSSGNEFLKLVPTASAVNELTIANAATGNSPLITASGGDANVGIDFLLKGTGRMKIDTSDRTDCMVRLNNAGATTGGQMAGIQVGFSDSRRAQLVSYGDTFGAPYSGWNAVYSEGAFGLRFVAYSGGKLISFVNKSDLSESARFATSGNFMVGTTDEAGQAATGGISVLNRVVVIPTGSNPGAMLTVSRSNGGYFWHIGMDGSSNFNLYDNDGTTVVAQLDQSTKNWECVTGDLEVISNSKGVVLKSPDNTRWRISIDNAGVLSTTSI